MEDNLIKSFGSSSKGNSILVGDILLDAGISPDKIKPKPKAVLITHSHGDHIKYMNAWMKRGLKVYSGEIKPSAFGKVVNPWDIFYIGDVRIQALPSIHDTSNALNFVLDTEDYRVLYEVDNAKRTYELSGITHYIAECNWDEATLAYNIDNGLIHPSMEHRLRSTHKSLEILAEELIEMDRSQLKEIWLAHGSETNLNIDLAKLIIQEITGVPVYIA